MPYNRQRLKMMIITALFAAIIGILAQVTIPLPLVPITGQTLAIGLAATILGSRYGTFSVILYLIIGAAGIPVFAEMSGGISKIFGPTGGYLIGFIPTAYFTGLILEKTRFKVPHAIIANIVGMLIALTFGTIWLKYSASLTWTAAIAGGAAPFLLVGVIKAAIAGWVGILVRNRLEASKMLPQEKVSV
ncbi:biotin transporter BioY [Peribacillus cavernae]|uniref:Biotin transporter n=1 Tax=Peribacillus cavernae TaxID=1674310 RepID=A0A3S0U1G8_9BACI|nr:biotin transporter BioY [Peribacillus cavernae]MDQ0217832.1 biotin transport system substrate-specific component [Peribacillus cavernae]RUQ28276.1 biotin transporter BioY [Peribacillus cavernae]